LIFTCCSVNFVADFLTWTRAPGSGVPCGPLSKHRCVVTVQPLGETAARRNLSLTTVHPKHRVDSSPSLHSALDRREPRRSTFPQRKSEATATCDQTSSAEERTTISVDENAHSAPLSLAVPLSPSKDCVEVCVSSFKRKHKVSSDELMECDDVGYSSREDLVPSSSSRDLLKTLTPSCFQSATAKNGSGIDNLVFSIKDECVSKSRADNVEMQYIDPRLAVEKLGSHENTSESWREQSMNSISSPRSASVELDCFTSNGERQEGSIRQILLEDLDQPNGSSPGDFMDSDAATAASSTYFRSQFVKEAWTSIDDDQQESSLSSPNADSVQVRQLFPALSLCL
jgi:hypothetical protein